MGRIRTIKPEFAASESVGRLSREARLLFIQLWTLVDDEGKARGAAPYLAGMLYPYDEDAGEHIADWLGELVGHGFIERYQVNRSWYLRVCSWRVHQKIDHPAASKLPDPAPNTREDARELREPSRALAKPSETLAPVPRTLDLGPGIVDRGSGPGTEVSIASQSHPAADASGAADASPGLPPKDSPVEAIYAAYPRKVGRGAAIPAIEKAIKRLVKGEHPQPPLRVEDARALLRERTTAYARSPAGQNPDETLIPHPATWYNQARYLDDDTSWQAGGRHGHPRTHTRDAFEQYHRGEDALGDAAVVFGERAAGPAHG